MKNAALITGTSSGIGKELARLHAAAGGDMVVVARRLEALEKLKTELESEYGVRVIPLVADLTEPAAAREVYESVRAQEIEVDVLINNAGFGGHGLFHEREWSQDQAMIQLNITTLSELTHLFLQGMVERRRGKILNVASTAGFIPGPLQAVYYATKAFVLSFSQAVSEEVREHGVSVTVLCPGPVATEFTQVGNLEGASGFKNAASPDGVARVGYDAMQKGKLVAINDWKLSFLLNWVVPFLPRRTVLRMSRQTMEKP